MFCYTENMAIREIDLKKLVVSNYSTEEILSYCVYMLGGKMTEETLGDKKIYWEILEELEKKICGQKRAKIL